MVLAHAPAHAILDTPALDVFGSEELIESQTGSQLLPSQCPELPAADAKLQVMQAVHIALCNNPSTRASWFQLRAQAISLNSTKVSEWIPSVSSGITINHGYTRSDGQTDAASSTSTSASLGYKLFDFGVREATIEAAEKSLRAAMTSYDSSLQGLIATTLSRYYSLLSAGYSLDAARDSSAFAKRSLEAAETRFKLGLVPKSSVLQAKASYTQSLLSVEQSENAIRAAHNNLLVTMGLDPTEHAQIQVADIDESQFAMDDFDVEVKTLIEIAKRERRDLQSQEQSLASSLASLEATKRGNLPTVNMSASQTYSDIGINDRATQSTGTLGFSVSIPIFSGFTRSYSIKNSEQSIKAQRLSIEQTKLSIAQDVWSAYNDYKTAQQNWMTSLDALNSSAELRDIALGQFKAGVGSLLDVESAQSSYASSLSSYISSRFSMLSSRVDLIRAVGILDINNAKPNAPIAEVR